jgi:phosphoglycolate phosphatase
LSGARTKLLALDLDGTLVDSAPDIAHCLGVALEAVGFDAPGEARTRTWIGDGIETVIARAASGSAA